MISKRETILQHDPEGSSEDLMAWSNMRSLLDDHPEGEIPVDSVVIVMLPKEMWEQMDRPTELTVAIKPGDHLNRPALTGDDSFSGIRIAGATELGEKR